MLFTLGILKAFHLRESAYWLCEGSLNLTKRNIILFERDIRSIREDEAIKLADFLEKAAKELRSMYKNDSTQ
jgi:hypothetical protein